MFLGIKALLYSCTINAHFIIDGIHFISLRFFLEGTNSNEEDSSKPSLEDKVERAKVLLAEKQSKTAREKAEVRTMLDLDFSHVFLKLMYC